MDTTGTGSSRKVNELFNSKKNYKYGELVKEVADLGPSAIPELIEVVRGDDKHMIDACMALAMIGDPSAVEPLSRELSRWLAADKFLQGTTALSQLVTPGHAGMFLDILVQAKDKPSHDGAAIVLGHLAGKGVDAPVKDRIVELLLQEYQKELQEKIPRPKNLFIALGATKDPRVIGPLIAWFDKPSDDNSAAIALINALGNFNDDRVVDVLISQLKAHGRGLDSLGRTGSRRAVAPLLDVLKGSDPMGGAHKNAVKALGIIGDASAVEAVINCLSTDRDPRAREEAAVALGLIKDGRAIEALKKAQLDAEDYVREAATKSLDVLGVHEAPPQVIDPPKMHGFLVLCHDELGEGGKSDLLFEILMQQQKLGYKTAKGGLKQVVRAVGDSVNDEAYIYASIRSEFSAFGGADLINRAYKYDFKASNGNYGHYYVIFTRPKD